MTVSNKTIRIFIDESGTRDSFVNGKNEEHDKFFTIAAALISQKEYVSFKEKLQAINKKYKKYLLGKEIKSNFIRSSNPKYSKCAKKAEYQFHLDLENGQRIYDEFCTDIKSLILGTNFEIISVTTNKVQAKNSYPHLNFYEIMLCDLWERVSIFYVINKAPKMKIVFDRTKSDADTVLKMTYSKFKANGSTYWNGERLGALKLDKDVYSCDSEDSAGIQLADLCAYPIKKHEETNNHSFFNRVIKPKLHSNVIDKRNGNTINMGNKRSLNRI